MTMMLVASPAMRKIPGVGGGGQKREGFFFVRQHRCVRYAIFVSPSPPLFFGGERKKTTLESIFAVLPSLTFGRVLFGHFWTPEHGLLVFQLLFSISFDCLTMKC